MKIIQEHNKCIGCGSCVAICPKYWEIADDGKSKLKGATIDKNKYELEVNKLECNQQAADVCPVQCIIIKK
jgi:ferredoxin